MDPQGQDTQVAVMSLTENDLVMMTGLDIEEVMVVVVGGLVARTGTIAAMTIGGVDIATLSITDEVIHLIMGLTEGVTETTIEEVGEAIKVEGTMTGIVKVVTAVMVVGRAIAVAVAMAVALEVNTDSSITTTAVANSHQATAHNKVPMVTSTNRIISKAINSNMASSNRPSRVQHRDTNNNNNNTQLTINKEGRTNKAAMDMAIRSPFFFSVYFNCK